MNEKIGKRVDIFKILSHETRRKIILFIGENEYATFTQLSKIEPKPGKLYYHLNIMRDLIFQDDDNFYRLTPLGQKVYEILVHEKLESFSTKHTYGFRTLVNIVIDRLSTDATIILNFVLFFLLIIIVDMLGVATIPFYAIPTTNGVVSTTLSTIIAGLVLILFLKQRDLLSLDRTSKLLLYYIISLYIVLPSYSIYAHFVKLGLRILGLVIMIILQTLALINFSSGISSTLKMSFSRSIILPLMFHYVSSAIVYFHLASL